MSKHNGGRFAPTDANLAAMAAQAPVINTAPESPVRDITKPVEPHPFDGIRLLGHWVLLEKIRTEEFTQGGILVPEAAQRPVWQVMEIGERVAAPLKQGDIVLTAGPVPENNLDGRTFAIVIMGDGSPGMPEQISAVLDKTTWRNQPAKPQGPRLVAVES